MVETEDIEIDLENREIIELDLLRTCSTAEDKKRAEHMIYNFMLHHENTIGYFQGLNFIAFYLVLRYEHNTEAFPILLHLSDTVFIQYFNLDGLKTGNRVLSLFHSAERLLQINFPSMYSTF